MNARRTTMHSAPYWSDDHTLQTCACAGTCTNSAEQKGLLYRCSSEAIDVLNMATKHLYTYHILHERLFHTVCLIRNHFFSFSIISGLYLQKTLPPPFTLEPGLPHRETAPRDGLRSLTTKNICLRRVLIFSNHEKNLSEGW